MPTNSNVWRQTAGSRMHQWRPIGLGVSSKPSEQTKDLLRYSNSCAAAPVSRNGPKCKKKGLSSSLPASRKEVLRDRTNCLTASEGSIP